MMIGNNISMLLGARRKSIRDFARDTGISYTTCFDLYHAKNKAISFELLDKLCDYFESTPNDLFPYSPKSSEVAERGKLGAQVRHGGTKVEKAEIKE